MKYAIIELSGKQFWIEKENIMILIEYQQN